MSFLSVIGGIASPGASSTAAGGNAKPLAASGTDFDAILAKLKKVGSQTPVERAREHVLKKHKLTEDEYQKLPQDKRETIDKEIATMARNILQQQAEAQKKQHLG